MKPSNSPKMLKFKFRPPNSESESEVRVDVDVDDLKRESESEVETFSSSIEVETTSFSSSSGSNENTNDSTNSNLELDKDKSELETLRSKRLPDWKTKIPPFLQGLKFLGEILLSQLIAVLALPLILTWILSLLLARFCAGRFLLLKYKGRFSLMSGADAAWALTRRAHDNCFTCFYIIEGSCSIEKIRQRVKTALLDYKGEGGDRGGGFVYWKFRARIATKLGFYCWDHEDSEKNFPIAKHVQLLREDVRERELSCKEILDVMREDFMDEPLPEEDARWKIYVVPKFRYERGLEGRSYYVIIWRLNHSVADGLSSINAMQACIADAPVEMTVDTVNPSFLRGVKWYHYLPCYARMAVFGPRLLIRSLALPKENCFQGPELTGPKNLALTRPLKVEALRGMRKGLGCSTNGILISALSGALKGLAERKALPVPEKLIGASTSAVLPYPDYATHNRFTVNSFEISLNNSQSRLQRLKRVEKVVGESGNLAEILKNFGLIRLIGLNPRVGVDKIVGSLKACFLLSNVPGPRERYRIFYGDELVELMAWNTIKGRTGIGLCLLSYAGRIRGALIVDGAILPNPKDVEALIEEFEGEVVEFAKLSGIEEDAVFD